jgi:hypothetical protein
LHYIVSNNQPSLTPHNTSNIQPPPPTSSSTPPVINNQDSSSIKTIQRRKKGPGHRRNNSKGSATSWTPPSLSAIADQEQKRASDNLTSNGIEEIFPTNQTFDTSTNSPIPSISADIDLKSTTNNRKLNPKTLKLDLQNSIDSEITPTNHQRPSTLFTYALRKSSSSDPEDFNENQHQNLSRQRRRRNLNLPTNKISSPSSVTIHSIKSTPNTPQLDELETNHHTIDEKNDNEKVNDLRRHPKNVSFHFSPSITNERSPSYPQRKTFNNRVN